MTARPRLGAVIFLSSLASLAVLSITSDVSFAQSKPPAGQLDSASILAHLNAVINWYRHCTTNIPPAGEPSDEIYESNMRQFAANAARLAFQSSKAEALLIPAAEQTKSGAAGSNAASAQHAQMRLSDLANQISGLQSQIAALNDQIKSAPRSKIKSLTAQRDSLAGELDMDQALQGVMEQFLKVDTGNNEGLLGSITQLERSVPDLANTANSGAKPSSTTPSLTNNRGLFGKLDLLYQQFESVHKISQLINESARVKRSADALHTPLLAEVHTTLQNAQNLAAQLNQSQSAANSSPPTSALPQPNVSRQKFDAMSAEFKKLANAAVPLSQELLVLDQARENLTEWRASIQSESDRNLRSILLQVGGIALAMAVVLLLSEFWRRITFRYIHDIRRRRQFLMLRRIVVGFCMGLVLVLGLVSEFSSLATFAGFITAGLAVGLQTILLSVAAYFFLVGRWGIRVGDRISIAGVTGDVVDVGLIRIYLLELAGTTVDLYRTGRIIVLSNSVLFQPTTPLFKQLPGTEYTWHEIVVTLTPASNYKLVEDKMLAIVQSVYEEYREDFARQHGDVERRIDIQIQLPTPHALLQYSDTGLDYVVRYPVGLDRVAIVDEKITRALLEETEKDQNLKSAITGLPKLRAAIKG